MLEGLIGLDPACCPASWKYAPWEETANLSSTEVPATLVGGLGGGLGACNQFGPGLALVDV